MAPLRRGHSRHGNTCRQMGLDGASALAYPLFTDRREQGKMRGLCGRAPTLITSRCCSPDRGEPGNVAGPQSP